MSALRFHDNPNSPSASRPMYYRARNRVRKSVGSHSSAAAAAAAAAVTQCQDLISIPPTFLNALPSSTAAMTSVISSSITEGFFR